MTDRYVVNVCVALHRAGRWLLAVRGPDVANEPNLLGLVGGHLEPDLGVEVLEETGRREVAEEVGLDLAGTPLTYLDSELFSTAAGAAVLAVTFVAEVPADQEPTVAAPAELASIGWWTLADLEADDTCPAWTLRLVRRAALAVLS